MAQQKQIKLTKLISLILSFYFISVSSSVIASKIIKQIKPNIWTGLCSNPLYVQVIIKRTDDRIYFILRPNHQAYIIADSPQEALRQACLEKIQINPPANY